jgi:TolB-like protein
MTSSTNFLNKAWMLFFAGVLCLSGCAWTKKNVSENAQTQEGKFLIAVLPFENLSGTNAPLKDIRELFINKLRARGFSILEEETLENFMAKHRVRYTGGIGKPLAQAFKNDTGTGGVLITSLELYSDVNPPKIALTSRLVSSGDAPVILWIDGFGLAGDDSPGILELGLIEDPKALVGKGVGRLVASLGQYFDKKPDGGHIQSMKGKFRPKVSYRSNVFDPSLKYTVAVVPFLNFSGRKNAGEILELEFIRNLKTFEQFDVIEPGMVRQQLLTMRMIIPEGISLANADALFAVLNVDLILAANVIEYQDYQGVFGKPKVDFFVQLIEKKSRSVVWSSVSHNEGDDGVFFFDLGRVNTAHAMASQMTRWIGEMMMEGSKRVQEAQRNKEK